MWMDAVVTETVTSVYIKAKSEEETKHGSSNNNNKKKEEVLKANSRGGTEEEWSLHAMAQPSFV